jgi:hypothetical protein
MVYLIGAELTARLTVGSGGGAPLGGGGEVGAADFDGFSALPLLFVGVHDERQEPGVA